MIKIGNAPVSYGAFEVTVGHDPDVPSAESVLDAVASAGYEGIDLGPIGYLGLGPDLQRALTSRGLALTGGYLEIDVSDDETPSKGFAELDLICDQFDAVSEDIEKRLKPRPTVALVTPGRPPQAESDEDWARIERVLGDLVARCERRGYEACLHNEVGTRIASTASIERALSAVPVSLCLDTGHLIAAGGDPVILLDNWRDRVTHVHLKDAAPDSSQLPYKDAMKLWEDGVFCRLGAGIGAIDALLEDLRAGEYAGWVLVEQDILPRGQRVTSKPPSTKPRTDAICESAAGSTFASLTLARERKTRSSSWTLRFLPHVASARRQVSLRDEDSPQFPSRVDAEFGKNIAQVVLDGLHADIELPRYLAVAEALCHQGNDIAFAVGQV